jgi:hypothetical protein
MENMSMADDSVYPYTSVGSPHRRPQHQSPSGFGVEADDSTVDTLDMLKDWTLDAIYAETTEALKGAQVAPTAALMERLQYYRVVDHPEKLEKGAHLCYFKRDENAPAYIHTGIFCRVNPRVTEKCGTWLVCKNYGSRGDGRPVFYQICFDAHVVFQRFTADQEVLIKSAELLL